MARLTEDEIRQIGRARYGLADVEAPYRGAPIQANHRKGPRPGAQAARANVGRDVRQINIPLSNLRSGLSRLRRA